MSAPLLGLAALAIKLEDGGPVLYRQTRVGKDGADFELLKLRTMVVGAERRRLSVKPGLTGWAQTHGRAALSWEERIELDLWYVEHRSPRLDLEILLRTPLALFAGTYRGATGGWRET